MGNGVGGPRGARGGEGVLFNGTGFPSCKMKEFWRWTAALAARPCECAECHSAVHLKWLR